MTPRLVRASDDTTVWTHPYDAPLVDLLAVQTDIAHQITSALEVAIDARERRALSARPTEDTEAYMAYLNGLAFAQQGWSDTASNAQARAWMEKAVARDPRFALAWSLLARILARQYTSGASRSPEVRISADQAAKTALALAPDLPDAHLATAEILIRDRDYHTAEQQLELVRTALPQSSDAWRMTGVIMERGGRWREGRTAYLRAFDLDPASLADTLAQHYLHMRQYDEARRYAGLARAANRSGAVVPEAWARFSEGGDIAGARTVLEAALAARTPADGRAVALLARLEWFDGRYERALELVSRMDPAGAWLAPNFRYPAAKALALAGLERRSDAIRHAERAVALLPVSRDAVEGMLYFYLLAQVQARVGELDAAIATLDRLFDIPGFYSEAWLTREPWFASLSGHPGFRQALSRWSTRKGDALLHTN